MSIYKDIKNAVSFTVNMVVDKTASQAQKSRLLTVMKTEAKNADRLYIQLGQYLYSNLRDTLPEEIAHTCDLIDESKERMSRAQAKYREVLQQELISSEINKSEAKENFVKIKEPIVAKAKDTAVLVKDKAVDAASRVKIDTAARVDEIKKSAVERKINRQKIEPTEEADVLEEAVNDEIGESIIEVKEEADVNEAIQEALTGNDDICAEDTESIAENYEEKPRTAEPRMPVIMKADEPLTTKFVSEAAAEAEDTIPHDKPYDQEFQRSMPVDIISETEFEENEPEIKPLEKSNPIAKAMKLRRIISKKEDSEE